MIQRYENNGLHIKMEKYPEGAWVKFSDHQQALAAAEGRVKELEFALSYIASGIKSMKEDPLTRCNVITFAQIEGALEGAALRGEAPGEEGK